MWWVGAEPSLGQDLPQPQPGPPGMAVPVRGPQTPYCLQEASCERRPRAEAAQPRHRGGCGQGRVAAMGGTGGGVGGGSSGREGVNGAAEERKGCSCGAGSRAWGKQGWAQLASISSSCGTGRDVLPGHAPARSPHAPPTPPTHARRGAGCPQASGDPPWCGVGSEGCPVPSRALRRRRFQPHEPAGPRRRCHRCRDGAQTRCPGHSPPRLTPAPALAGSGGGGEGTIPPLPPYGAAATGLNWEGSSPAPQTTPPPPPAAGTSALPMSSGGGRRGSTGRDPPRRLCQARQRCPRALRAGAWAAARGCTAEP